HAVEEVVQAVVVGIGELGCLLVVLDRPRVIAHSLVSDAQVPVRRNEVGFDGEGPVQVLDRLVVVPRIGLDLSNAVVGIGLVGNQGLVLRQILDRLFVFASVPAKVSDLVVGLGVAGIDGE